MIRRVCYQTEFYQRVCDFLIELNQEDENHAHWNWARFEWMHEHPLTKKELLGEMGLWFEDDHLIGAVLFDMFFGEAFVATLKSHSFLYPELLTFAFEHLRDDQGLGIALCEDDALEIDEAKRQGFEKAEAVETVCRISLAAELPVALPQGFAIECLDAQENQEEIEWLFWQGFNHGEDKEEFLQQFTKTSQKRPHFNPFLCIVVRNEKGEAVASASTWYDPRTDYAYLEPVCVIPKYRKLGLGKAAVYTALNHARELGVKQGIVVSDQAFYARIGFVPTKRYPFYWKKEERVVHGVTYKLDRLLGKGKGGYSYLAKAGDKEVVLKQIHHEPCDYYQFGNKIEAEDRDYQRLLDAGIRIPRRIDIDPEQEIVIKEFIDGPVIADLLQEGKDVAEYLPQLEEMAKLARKKNLNVDYYPTNFVVMDGLLYYIDYECNEYMEEWSLENWGLNQWRRKK